MLFPKSFMRCALFLVLSAGLILAGSNGARAGNTEDAQKFIQGLGDKAISILSDKSVTSEAAAKTFHDMLVDGFDIDLLGKFALGPTSWKAATPEQRQKYMQLFEKLVVQIYSDRFSLYHGETWKVVGAKAEDERDTYVTGTIIKPNPSAQPVKVDWRVRNKGGKQVVIDVIVEGVSMTVTQRSEFASVLQRSGGDFNAFLQTLGERTAVPPPEPK